jgi:hypothetical protein
VLVLLVGQKKEENQELKVPQSTRFEVELPGGKLRNVDPLSMKAPLVVPLKAALTSIYPLTRRAFPAEPLGVWLLLCVSIPKIM